MPEIRLYDGNNCPCPSDCKRRGQCSECIEFHRRRHQQTYCEFLMAKMRSDGIPHRAVKSGREIRLTDYGPCAG